MAILPDLQMRACYSPNGRTVKGAMSASSVKSTGRFFFGAFSSVALMRLAYPNLNIGGKYDIGAKH